MQTSIINQFFTRISRSHHPKVAGPVHPPLEFIYLYLTPEKHKELKQNLLLLLVLIFHHIRTYDFWIMDIYPFLILKFQVIQFHRFFLLIFCTFLLLDISGSAHLRSNFFNPVLLLKNNIDDAYCCVLT